MLFTTVQQTVQQVVASLTGRPVSEGFSNSSANYFALLITMVLWVLLVLLQYEHS
mgnify:FL=1